MSTAAESEDWSAGGESPLTILPLKSVRYLCTIRNDLGGVYAWNAARRRPDSGAMLQPGEQIVLGCLGEWIELQQLTLRCRAMLTEAEILTALSRLLAEELIVTSADPTADHFPEQFVVVGTWVDNTASMVEVNAILRGASRIATVYRPVPADTPAKQLWGHKMVCIDGAFSRLTDSQQVFDAVADDYLDLALQEPDVVYLTYGHPWVGEAIPQCIEAAAWRRFGQHARVVPAFSSLDQMFARLRWDPFIHPLSVVRPSALGLAVNSAVATLIVLVGGYEKYGALARGKPNFLEIVREELASIRETLLRHFPPTHPIYLLSGDYDRYFQHAPQGGTAGLPRDSLGNTSLPLELLPNFADHWSSGASSLFVPRLG